MIQRWKFIKTGKNEKKCTYIKSIVSDQCVLLYWYMFDFGDEWIFQCKVLRILDEPTIHAVTVKSVGDAPRQYSYYDEDEEGQTNE